MINMKKNYIKTELKKSKEILSNITGYSLDKEQRIAVVSDYPATLILAGAGSGKTLTMIGKVRYLIELKDIDPKDILCISFTKEASKNLERKIKENYNYNINVYTFHKLALILLENENYKICDQFCLEYVVNEYFYIIKDNKEMINKVKRVLNCIDTSYNKILKSKSLINLERLIITFINLFKTNNCNLNEFLFIKYNKDLVRIILDIYFLYENELQSTNEIDFNDLIIKARQKVKYSHINYKYIIIDEYQDTSYIRYLFIKEIINKTGAKIICVGDDYQSIYRFTGCNINMFLNFKKYFRHAKILKINNTYRNSQELINVASKFIMKNKNQLYKKLKSKKHIDKPIKLYYGKDLKKLLDIVLKKYKNILVLGRNNFDINEYFNLNNGYFNYKGNNIRYLTIHSSKGLEEDCVVIINLKDSKLGIPNKIIDNKILKYVNKSCDTYPYEEERRLFYVALTRTKGDLYLFVDKKNPSIFVKELIKYSNKYIEYI